MSDAAFLGSCAMFFFLFSIFTMIQLTFEVSKLVGGFKREHRIFVIMMWLDIVRLAACMFLSGILLLVALR